MAVVAYYRDGYAYDSENRPIITIGPDGKNNSGSGSSSKYPWSYPQGGSNDPVKDRMDHLWEGQDFNMDEVTKEEQAYADARAAEIKKAFLADKAVTETVLSQNKKSEQTAKDNLTKVNNQVASEKKTLSTTKDSLDKFAIEYKINELEIEQKTAEINYNFAVASRIGTDSHYYNLLAFDSYNVGGLSADTVRARLKISEEKNAESEKYFEKVNVLRNQLKVLQQQKEAKNLDSSVKTINDIITTYGEGVAKIISDKLGNQAKELAKNIKGKKIRSYNDAMATFEKIKSNPNLKVNAKDKEAISKALKALNVSKLSSNFNLMAKTFKGLEKGFNAKNYYEKAKVGLEDGNWEPLLLEIEAVALSGVASAYTYGIVTAILSGIGIAALSSPPALIIVFLLTAFMSSYIDADAAKKFNDIIIPSAF